MGLVSQIQVLVFLRTPNVPSPIAFVVSVGGISALGLLGQMAFTRALAPPALAGTVLMTSASGGLGDAGLRSLRIATGQWLTMEDAAAVHMCPLKPTLADRRTWRGRLPAWISLSRGHGRPRDYPAFQGADRSRVQASYCAVQDVLLALVRFESRDSLLTPAILPLLLLRFEVRHSSRRSR